MIKNQLKTTILLGLLTALLLWVGRLLGGANGFYIALVLVVGMNFVSFFYSDKIVLSMYKASQIDDSSSDPQFRRLVKITREVSRSAGIPMPKVYVINNNQANAFATGRSPKHAAVAATVGLLGMLNDRELKGVIAHETSHIKHRDTLIATVAASIAGIIGFIASMARWTAIFGGFGGRDRENGSGLELIVLMVLTPLIATIIQLSISRSREYLADESAGKITHDPIALADALLKIEGSVHSRPFRNESKAAASLFIANPFRNGGLSNLFSTHPSTKERIKRLKNMKA